VVTRAALVDRLAAADVPFITVVAPPGYGKTTLLAQWAGRLAPRVAWVSCDDADNDPVVLFSALAAALDRIEPVEPAIFWALASSGAGITVVPRLVSAIAAMPPPVTLVLDHAEAVTNKQCLITITELALRLPKGCQLALASRRNVPLPTARLRAQGQILEITAEDLAMDPAEASSLLEGAGIEPGVVGVPELLQRTEGWPAGLYLAALAMRAGLGPGEVGSAFTGDDRFMGDYLRAELLSHVSAADASFLTRTSVLDRMCGSLCDSILGEKGSAAVLEGLEARNLLVVPLDRRREWYRYHHLLRELLQAELRRAEPDLVQDLHFRAAAWYEANAMPEAAIEHAHAAGDYDRLARLVLELQQPVWASGRVETVLRWMEWLRDSTAAEHFGAIAVHGALIYALLGQPSEAERWAAAAERASPAGILPDGSTMAGTLAYLRAILTRAVNDATRAGALPLTALILSEQCHVAAEHGDWKEITALAERAVGIVQAGRFDDYWTSALVYASATRAALHQGNIAQARHYLGRAARLRPLLSYALPVVSLQALIQMARAYISLADQAGAATVLQQADDILQQRPDLGVLPAQVSKLRSQLARIGDGAVGASALTAAELRLLPLLPTHLSFQEIGERLYVSTNTVKSQAYSAYRKLGVSSRSAAVTRARELGLDVL
jgi:LuxR family maltose regulon positive regulatory protein